MYNGLTTADKGALLDAKKNGALWIARDEDGAICGHQEKPEKSYSKGFYGNHWKTSFPFLKVVGFELDQYCDLKFIQWIDAEPVNIDIALAQIAEMETAQTPTLPPLTWNERINQMTVEEKADVAVIMSKRCSDALSKKICPDMTCWQCFIEFLNSPYTEGATK